MSSAIYLLSPLIKEDTIALPMIRFSMTANVLDLTSCDVLMFTSKQAVKSADQLNPDWKNIPSLAIGTATAKQIEQLGGKVLYQPKSFYGETLSQDIIEKFHDKKILYLRPKVVSFDSKTFLTSAGVHIEEQVLYETSCISYDKNKQPSKNAIIIFTSPSTIHCFLKNFIWDESYMAIVIGEATKQHLPHSARYEVAEEATIDACVRKAKHLLTANRL